MAASTLRNTTVAVSSTHNQDVDYEFKYYCILLRELEPLMSEEPNIRGKLLRWIHLLIDPLASTQNAGIRETRNRYLFMMVTAVMTGSCVKFLALLKAKSLPKKPKPAKVFRRRGDPPPPEINQDPLADPDGIPLRLATALDPAKFEIPKFEAEWEHEKYWEIRLSTIKEAQENALKGQKNVTRLKTVVPVNLCSFHDGVQCESKPTEEKIGRCLDNQFNYLLNLCERYQTMMTQEKEKINLWLQALVKIDRQACHQMKGVRNDYIRLLAGYLFHKELKGPFEDFPTTTLPPLSQAIATHIQKRKEKPKKQNVPLNPVSHTVEAFMNQVPTIEEGAFALFSLSGSLFN